MQIKVLKIVTDAGVFYNKEQLEGTFPNRFVYVRSQEVISMEESDYDTLPATESAKRFFEGRPVGERPLVRHK